MIEQQKKARRDTLVTWYLKQKTGKPCTDCGGTFHPVAMEWDHLDRDRKRANVSRLVSHGSLRALQEEMSKCELVCANCHAVRTFERNQRSWSVVE